jgi:hypothetical protein
MSEQASTLECTKVVWIPVPPNTEKIGICVRPNDDIIDVALPHDECVEHVYVRMP